MFVTTGTAPAPGNGPLSESGLGVRLLVSSEVENGMDQKSAPKAITFVL